eukprot:TRINITY_DN2448_c2_g6_i1.p1 TRINITY_DN2448_c2_g6~~TRINITY_DN2448_c2_g6_i1.p1  ORF type:complete len:241 (-),score=111.54 TRINITY_DN2448_c2_g6_i1:93-815(-)
MASKKGSLQLKVIAPKDVDISSKDTIFIELQFDGKSMKTKPIKKTGLWDHLFEVGDFDPNSTEKIVLQCFCVKSKAVRPIGSAFLSISSLPKEGKLNQDLPLMFDPDSKSITSVGFIVIEATVERKTTLFRSFSSKEITIDKKKNVFSRFRNMMSRNKPSSKLFDDDEDPDSPLTSAREDSDPGTPVAASSSSSSSSSSSQAPRKLTPAQEAELMDLLKKAQTPEEIDEITKRYASQLPQ